MKTLVFATHNKHKLQEIKLILAGRFEILGLDDIRCMEDIPETGDTLKANAYQKARYVKEHYGYDCFADDTGLEVRALGGAPGVYSARYSGPDATYDSNNAKLLEELKDKTDRSACFKTVICLINDGKTSYFSGEVCGHIIREKRGNEGFGYDPLFQPDGYQKTFAELGADIKNKISHRALAVRRLVNFLLEQ